MALKKRNSSKIFPEAETPDMISSHPTTNDLDRALQSLGSSERMVMQLRAGLIDGRRHTLREVGAFLGTSRAEARSIEWQSWQKLEKLAREETANVNTIQYLLHRCRGRTTKPRETN
jgi:DNA-directed RNA polymerase sigma subunit (sigma70/sigma32)